MEGTATATAKVPASTPAEKIMASTAPARPTWIKQLDKWQRKGAEIAKQDKKHQWQIADWMLQGVEIGEQAGKQKHKATTEMFNRAEQATGLDRSTLKTWASVARNMPRLLRDNRLSFYHHKEVADLKTDAEKKQWLKKAIDEKLSVAAFRKAIHATQGTPDPEPAPVTATKSVRPQFSAEQMAKIAKLAKAANKSEDDFVRDVVVAYLAKCQ